VEVGSAVFVDAAVPVTVGAGVWEAVGV